MHSRPSEENESKLGSNITHFRAASPVLSAEEQPETAPSTIYIVGTGGTIAGTAASATSASYAPSQLKVAQLLEAMPSLKEFGEEIKAVDVLQVNSEDIRPRDWLKLAKAVNKLLESPEVKGVVITHGTDTLEETAYFLDLVVKSDKPVVIVGSMRASTSLSADGPLNLDNAVAVVHHDDARGRGVMVMMNDTIYDGRDVTKCHTTKVNTFDSRNSGPIGTVNYRKVEFDRRVTRKHTFETSFDISEVEKLPKVLILPEYAGSNLLKTVLMNVDKGLQKKPDGIVFAGVGDGNLTARDRALLGHAKDLGIAMVRSARPGSGRVTEDCNEKAYLENDAIAGDNLNPQKARILLMLSLTQTKLAPEIRQNFGTY